MIEARIVFETDHGAIIVPQSLSSEYLRAISFQVKLGKTWEPILTFPFTLTEEMYVRREPREVEET